MSIRESGEMYLETILILQKQGRNVRSIDVAEKMGFSKPSISRAMGILRDEGLLTVEKDGVLKLTENGRSVAEKIYERHTILSEALTALGVEAKTAEEDACRIEHVISDESFEAIKHFRERKQ